jgi:RNA recognition motif-containing protein
MAQKLYIGNLPYRITEDDLRVLFSDFKPIHSLMLIADKKTGYPRGYGFIELDDKIAEMATSALHNRMYMGRNIRVGKAVGRNPREEGKRERVCCRRCITTGRICPPVRR